MKKKSISKLKREADAVFSKWVRRRDKGVCFTCGVRKPEKEMQAGHFVPRNVNSLRYSPINVNCQCVQCNVFKNGNTAEYATRLVRKYGEVVLERLSKMRQELKQFTRQELENIIARYK